MKIIKLLGTEIKKEMKGELSTKFADIAYMVRKMHEVCGDSAFVFIDEKKAVLAVLDGVSGEPGAEQASSVAAIAILNHLKTIDSPSKEDIQEALIIGHSHIVYGLTTALVVVIERTGSFIAGSVGDSALYSLDKKGKIKLQIQPMRIVGEDSPIFRFLMYRNVIPTALGLPTDMEIYFKDGKLDPGDSLLLMTDAVMDNLIIEVEDNKVKDCSGEKDLKKIIGKQKDRLDIVKVVKKIRDEILKRMKDKVEIRKPNESLIIKPDDISIVGIQMKKIKKPKQKTGHSKRQVRNPKRK